MQHVHVTVYHRIPPLDLSNLQKPSEPHHHYLKSKHDNLDNQIMRAFLKAAGVRYKVANGQEALEMLRKSGQIRRDLNQFKQFCGIEGVQFSVSVIKWDSHIPQYPGMAFRAFIYGVNIFMYYSMCVCMCACVCVCVCACMCICSQG